MDLPFHEANQSEQVYRQMAGGTFDAFIAVDEQNTIIEWSAQAQAFLGWRKKEIEGKNLIDLIPEKHRANYQAATTRTSGAGQEVLASRRLEITAWRKDGTEIPVELNAIPVAIPERTIIFIALRDLSHSRAIKEEIDRQASISDTVINNIVGAIIVADLSERLIMINPAAQRLFGLKPVEFDSAQTLNSFELFLQDGKTPYPHERRPARRTLRGELVDGEIAFVRHSGVPDGVWVSINARPLHDSSSTLIGVVVVFDDITALRRNEENLAQQARVLQEQASLLDLAHDAILVRTIEDIIVYWNNSAERMYGYSRAEAIGQASHELLKTRFPKSLDVILARMQTEHYWEGELIQTAKDGRELNVFSQWALDFHEGRPYRYLETNADITQRIQAERALKQSQEDYRLLVEASTDYAIIMLDTNGVILSWNTGAENILGLPARKAIGLNVASLFTEEDLEAGEPQRELDSAAATGRAENDRWHLRHDGSRFWATGVVTPLRNPDGSLRGFSKIMRDETNQRLADEQIRFFANHDGLTALPNRVHFSNHLHQSIALSQRNKVPLALLLLDLDRFKQVNDTFGHHTGDLLLKEVALRILSSIRETDFVARLGGDEFVIIQADVQQPGAAETLARKLVLELGRPYNLEGQEIFSGASIGLCIYPSDARSSVELMKRADLALYGAKNAGRHTYQFYTPDLVTEQNWKKDREAALRGALKNHQFELYYQPQVNLRDWKITTVEALLRWNASDMEIVLPNEFLDIAEQSGIIVEVGEWALREACHQVRRWQAQGLDDLRLSVNCSARQFNDPRFVSMVPTVLNDTGLAPSSLDLEVPEAMLSRHPEIKESLFALRAFGIRLTIDNFGIGATALSELQDFGIDALKIDKIFVQHLPHRREDAAITSAIISLAHNLGVAVSAGGVETAEQLAYLKARDCTSAQGFIFSPPVPAAKLEELMQDGSWSRINRIYDGVPSGLLH